MASAFNSLHCCSTGEDRSSQVPWSLGTWCLDKQHKGLFWDAWCPHNDEQLWRTFPSLVLLIRKTSLPQSYPGCWQDILHQGWGCLFLLCPADAKVLQALMDLDLHPANPIFTAVPDPQEPCRAETPKSLTGDRAT